MAKSLHNMCWTHRNFRGERNINAKLTNEQADTLRAEYAAGGVTQKELALKYGLTQGNVSQVINNKAYKKAA